jgi:hypothetical protein
MYVAFLQNGESPEFGVFKIGDERDVPDDVGKVLVKRGVCKKKTSKVKVEDKGNG